MASTNKRSLKFQEFMAHEANVNCLALGHKSGRVLVTGGDDKKVNLWAVGKSSCFMSLSGHMTPIECVQFNHAEEQVCAGSRAGALKIWDLEAAKLLRTLTGHKYAIKSIDFHPYSDYVASGGADSSIKVWDSRRKGCILTYNDHQSTVNSLKFSPDGNWLASGGDDGFVKIFDLRVGRVLKDFNYHTAPVTSVQFHPHEFLLATGSKDRSVQIFDLENFNLVSSDLDVGFVRNLWFHPDGECLFVGVRDYLKVFTWEPSKIQDTLFVDWGRVCDLSSAHNQLIGASFHLTNVQVYIVDLTKVQPFAKTIDIVGGSPFTPTASSRRSFSKAERPATLKMKNLAKTIEESTSGTDPEEDASANITNLTDYNEIFKGRTLSRTPPPASPPASLTSNFQEPEHDYSDDSNHMKPQKLEMINSFEALSLDNSINNYRNTHSNISPIQYSRSKSNLDHIYDNLGTKNHQQQHHEQQEQLEDRENFLPNINKSTTKFQVSKSKLNVQRQTSYQDEKVAPKNNFNIKQSFSDVNLTKNNNNNNGNMLPPPPPPVIKSSSRRSSFSKSTRNSNSTRLSNINSSRSSMNELKSNKFISSTPDIYTSSKLSPDHEEPLNKIDKGIIPGPLDKPVGLDIDDFLPKHHQIGAQQQLADMSEAEVLNVILRGHEPMMSVIATRRRSLKLVSAQFRSKGIKASIEMAIAMDDLAVLVDVLGVFNERYSIWNLDLCVTVLPKLPELLQSKFESYILTGCNTLKLILRHFGPVIKTNIQSPAGSFGVDIPREERYRKSVKCHEELVSIRPLIMKNLTASGNVGAAFKEVNSLMRNVLD